MKLVPGRISVGGSDPMNSSPAETAFAELLERNYPRWFGIARAYASGDGREDLLQEILLQVWKALPDFAKKSQIDTWAYRIAINTGLAWSRSAKNRQQKIPTESAELSQLASQRASSLIAPKILDEFLQSLSKVDRAVMLVHLDGLETAQASVVTGLSAGALRVRMHRLKKRFQELYCDTLL